MALRCWHARAGSSRTHSGASTAHDEICRQLQLTTCWNGWACVYH
jgi:hypothetical protein